MPRAPRGFDRLFDERALVWAMGLASALLLVLLLAFDDIPMVDLPQHAAQIASWVRLEQPGSIYAERFELNLRTPYVLANALARQLAPLFGVVIALKLAVWLSIVGNMLAVRRLAQRLGHDPFIALFGLLTACGLCFYFGFISFMLAVTLGLFGLVAALDHARAPTLRSGLVLAVVMSLTLVAHGVAFALTTGIIGVALLRGQGRWFVRFAPLAGPALVALFFFLPGPISQRIGGDYWDLRWTRLLDFPALLASFGASDRFSFVLGLCVLGLCLFVLGVRPARWFERPAMLAGLLVAYAFFPVLFRGIALLHTRLPALLLPVLMLALSARPPQKPPLVRAGRGAILLVTATWLAVFGLRLVRFKAESASYHELVRDLPAGLAMRPIIYDRDSRVFPGVPAYLHYSAYYFVEKGGFQGYSFAMYPISVVRYRPSVEAGMQNAAEWRPELFDVKKEVPRYDYFLVKSETDRSAELFAKAPEQVVLTKRSGPWWGYEKAARLSASTGPARQ